MVGKEIIEHTPIDETPSIDEVFRVVTEFSGDSNPPQVDEEPEDNSTIVKELIGTEASKSMMELPDDSRLQLTGEHIVHIGLSMKEHSEAHVELVMEDVQPSFRLAIDEGQHRGHTLGFQHSSIQRHTGGVYNVINPPLRIGLREAKLSRCT